MADQVIEDIKNRLDIVDVLSGYMQLKKSGTGYKAVCPFHAEKTPSLMVSPQKQIWHCFGCNEGGDIFGFVMRVEGLEFREALKFLADRAGVVLPERSGFSKQADQEKDLLFRINTFAAEFYRRQLKTDKAKIAQEYISKRGISEKTLDQWQIGFAPEDFHALEKALQEKNVKLDALVKAGVSVKNEQGNIYDRFRNRITFPIFNYLGEVVGFTARTLDPNEKGAKYINSPETLIYNKSSVLFGLNFAKNDIRKNDNVIIVEGQMDVISCHQAGFINVVASSGTALTEQHLRTLSRLTKNLKFCFDSDSAGQAASRRAGELALSMGFAVKVVRLPEGKDPDELIKKDVVAWKDAIRDAVWFVDFYLELGLEDFPSNSLEQKKYLGNTVIPLVRLLRDAIERDHYVKKIAQGYGVTEQAVRQQLLATTLQNSMEADSPPVAASAAIASALEKQVLGGFLTMPELAEIGIEPEDFISPEIKQLVEQWASGNKDFVNENTLAKEAQFMVESELGELDGNSVALANELRKSAYTLRLNRIKREQELLSASIKTAEAAHDRIRLEELTAAFASLTQQRLAYENKINNK